MKSSILRLAFAASMGLLLTYSCTMPFYIGAVEPEQEIVYIEVTSTPVEEEEEEAAEEDAEPAATPAVAVNLDGEWTIWQGSSEQQLKISFLQKDYELVGNAATGDGHSLLFKGTISQDSSSATGNWESTSGTSGSFFMQLDSSKTSFSGNLGGGVPFCGSRAGDKPSSCLE